MVYYAFGVIWVRPSSVGNNLLLEVGVIIVLIGRFKRLLHYMPNVVFVEREK